MAYKDLEKKKAKRQAYDALPERRVKAAADSRKWREENPASSARHTRGTKLKSKYNMTLLEYEQLLVQQNGVCAICRVASMATRDGRKLAVDHNHTTSKVRGLLCMACNALLGCAQESEVILLSALDYLKRHA